MTCCKWRQKELDEGRKPPEYYYQLHDIMRCGICGADIEK